MAPTELECAEQRMQQRWYDLVMAEQKGAAVAVLERMYNAYMLAVEEYNHCSSLSSGERSKPQEPKKPGFARGSSGKKKAS
jgi:hypothetical protein